MTTTVVGKLAFADNGEADPSDISMPSIGAVDGGVSLTRDFSITGSSGVIDGEAVYITAASSSSINIAAGEGYIRKTNSPSGDLVFCEWGALLSQSIPAPAAGFETARFIGVIYDAGVPRIDIRTSFNWNWNNEFPLGRVTYDGTILRILNAYAHSEDVANKARQALQLTMPFAREESPEGSGGIVLGEKAGGGRYLTLSGGNIWHGFNHYQLSAVDTSIGTGFNNFHLFYSKSGGGFNWTAGNTQWPNTKYQNTTTGVLVTIGNGKYACLWVFLDIADNGLDIIYGIADYNSQALAQEEPIPTSVPEHLNYHGRLVGRIIFQESAASASLIESVWDSKFASNGVTDHGDLANTGTNTHAQIDSFISGAASSVQTLTNKNLSDSTTSIVDNSDATKKLQFQVEQVTTATTRTLTVQDVSGALAAAGSNDPLKSPRMAELGSAAFINISEVPRNYFYETVIADKTLTISDAGKVLLVSGTNIDITLPAASSLPSGWMVTIFNGNASNLPVAHASASANLPFGQNMVTVARQGSDTLNGQATNIHGFATIIGPKQSADIWVSSSSGFGAKGSDRIGWKDLTTEPNTHGGASRDPSESNVTGTFFNALEFPNSGAGGEKEIFMAFHLGHDYMMGTRLYPHVHWLTDSTATTVCRWAFQYTVAKGHQQQAFFTEAGGSTTVYVNQTKSATAYMHHIAEVSDADAIPATNLEPDSVILMRIYRDSANAADTFTGSAWVTNIDCHYLADRHATPNKSPAFYV